MSLERTVSYLLGLECDRAGILRLKLQKNKSMVQVGPIIHPPIRWIDSFERNASFDLMCTVTNERVPYMPGGCLSSLSRQSLPENEPELLFRRDSLSQSGY
jgi:hypothetical protein